MHLYYNVIMVIAVGKLLRNCYQLSTGKDFFTGHKLIGPEAEKEARHLLEMIFRTAIAAAATAAIYQASRRMPSKNYSIGAQCAGVILTALIGLKFSKYIAGSGWIAAGRLFHFCPGYFAADKNGLSRHCFCFRAALHRQRVCQGVRKDFFDFFSGYF